jgi:Fe-S cluster assembly protein SufD
LNTITKTDLPEQNHSENNGIAEEFAQQLESCRETPDWWKDMKTKAFDAFQSLPMPTRKNEEWRFANVKSLTFDGYDFIIPEKPVETKDLVEQSDVISNPSGQIIFADNKPISVQQISDDLKAKGVIWEPLSEALKHHSEVLKDYFMTQDPHLGSEKFAALHSAFVSDGYLLYVPKGVVIERPFIANHWAISEKTALFPHTLVIAEESSNVTLVDTFNAKSPGQENFVCGFNHLFAGANATLTYRSFQNWGSRTLGVHINSVTTGQDATVNTLSVNLGCQHLRSENQSLLKGAGSHIEMLSLCVADKEQELDQRTLQSHRAPHTTSNLLYKNVLIDKSKTIFSGLIKVAEEAQKTDAYQTNRNLLLSTEAEANALPGLEIKADDVKCSHGATTGQIDEAQLFYMLARGIKPHKAKELLVFGFFEEIISKIGDNELADHIRELIQTKFQNI